MSQDILKKLYDQQYEQGEWAGSEWYRKLKNYIKTREEVVASLVPSGTKSLLDVGCGEGVLLDLVSSRVSKLFGVDLLPRRISIAKKRLASEKKPVSLSVMNVDDGLSFSSSTFDVVTCVSVIEYVLDPYQAIAEFKRIIKKDGLLIVEVPNVAYLLERIRLLTGNLVGVAHSAGWQGGRLHHFTYSTLSKLLEANGFSIVTTNNSGLLHMYRNIWPELLASDIIIVARKN